jgi:hypothetical protein
MPPTEASLMRIHVTNVVLSVLSLTAAIIFHVPTFFIVTLAIMVGGSVCIAIVAWSLNKAMARLDREIALGTVPPDDYVDE